MSVRRWAVALVAAAGLPVALGTHASATNLPPNPPLQAWSSSGADTLDRWYDNAGGLYRSTGWWNSAHALEAELTASRLHGDKRGARRAARTYAMNRQTGFRNNYYDDEGWWALTWVKAYDTSGDPRYLKTAQSLFDDLTAGWDTTCGGGVWWSKARTYKNAVTNEIFIELAGQLALRGNGADAARHRSWALRGWNWFIGSGMINAARLINDGLDTTCHNNGHTTWTYNQGVILGAAVDLYRLTRNRMYLRIATTIADAATTALSSSDGILHEPCEPVLSRTIIWSAVIASCGNDGPQFKGIFMRYLTVLALAVPTPRYVDFVVHNAVSIWDRARNPGNEFGLIWSGPFDTGDAARQSSALACINSAAQLLDSRTRRHAWDVTAGV